MEQQPESLKNIKMEILESIKKKISLDSFIDIIKNPVVKKWLKKHFPIFIFGRCLNGIFPKN